MRKIKGSSNYLKNQVIGNLAKSAVAFAVFIAILVLVTYKALNTLQFGIPLQAGVVFMAVDLAVGYYYVHKSRVYRGGWEGEKQVANLLAHSLSDDYYLINDLYLRGGGGDIDHVVLAPGGVFVLETKNWNGKIICQGDTWQRPGKRAFNASPSKQVKHNTTRIKRIIESFQTPPMHVWVEGLVVLTNRNATVNLNNPTVPVLKLSELPNYILSHGGSRRFSAEQLEALGKIIVDQKA